MSDIHRRRHLLLLLAFSLSGAAALIYEVVWSKYLILMFGSTVQAQTIVLSTFMLGLAIGNKVGGSWANRQKYSLLKYAGIEFLIGIYALIFPSIYGICDDVFIRIGSGIVDKRTELWILKAGISTVILLPPTVLMGMTLPLILASVRSIRSVAGSSQAASVFYAVNSIGAVVGAGASGFVLIRQYGLELTLWMAGITNLLVGFIAIFIYSRARGEVNEQEDLVKPSARDQRQWLTMVDTVVLLTGAVSMGMEILASRCLVLVFGASTISFSIVLIAFILGLGVAGIIASSSFIKRQSAENITVGALILTFLALALGAGQLERWTLFYRYAMSGLAASPSGYILYLILNTFLSVIVIGIPAGILGLVLPVWMNEKAKSEKNAEQQIGKLLSFNTAGCVIGVLITGLWLMPRFGLRSTFLILASVLSASAVLLLLKNRKFILSVLILALTFGAHFHRLKEDETWQYILSAGIFRMRNFEDAELKTEMQKRKQIYKLLFYEDGTDATVSIETGRYKELTDQITLRVNGKADATSKGDLSTQYLLAHLPMLANPNAKKVFVLGFGSGITAGALLGHPIEKITISENCTPVLRAGKFFIPWNRDVQHSSRVEIFEEDARTILKLKQDRYDVIISEPSNPWMAGVGSVFSRQFYKLCASRLNPDGVMAQWFHVYEMDNEIISMVIRTFHSVYPCMEIWDSQGGDIILLGAKKPWNSSPESYSVGFKRDEVRADFLRIGLASPEAVWARQLCSQSTAPYIVENGRVQTDEYPILEYDAPRAFFMGKTASLLEKFDERTRLVQAADEKKRQVLKNLPVEILKPIFQEFTSVNSELRKQLVLKFEGEPAMVRELEKIPSIFSIQKKEAVLKDAAMEQKTSHQRN